MHLVDEHGLRGRVVRNQVDNILEAAKREALTLLFRHEFSKLFLVMNVANDRDYFVDRVHQVFVRHLLKHVLAENLGHDRLQTREFAGALEHRLSEFLYVLDFLPSVKRDNIEAVAVVVEEKDLVSASHHLIVHRLLEHN